MGYTHVPVGGHQKSLRILVLTSEAPPVVSGISHTVGMLTEGLRERGHQVDVVSRADFPRLVFREIRLSSFGLFWPRFRKRLACYDVVNLHGPVPSITEAFLLLLRTLPKPWRPGVVYTHHGGLEIPGLLRACGWYNRAVEALAHISDAIVVTSEDYREKLLSRQGTPVHVISWGISMAPCPPRLAPRSGHLRVLFVGQLRPYKGLAQLLSAVSGAPELDLTVIGEGQLRPQLEARVRREGLRNVRFLGRIGQDALWQAYAHADVIVLPSTTTSEAFGLVLLEGMRAGCVPVASDLPGVREVAGLTGVLVRPGNVEDLRAALRSLAADPVRLSGLSAASFEQAKAFGIDRVVESYERLLNHVAARVRAQQDLAVTPCDYPDAQSFLLDVSRSIGPGTTASLSLIDLTSGQHGRIWRQDREEAPICPAPVAAYVAGRRRPVLINGHVEDPQLVRLLRRSELTSSLLVPFDVDRGRVAVLGVSTNRSSGVVLQREDLEQTVRMLAGARRRHPTALAVPPDDALQPVGDGSSAKRFGPSSEVVPGAGSLVRPDDPRKVV